MASIRYGSRDLYRVHKNVLLFDLRHIAVGTAFALVNSAMAQLVAPIYTA